MSVGAEDFEDPPAVGDIDEPADPGEPGEPQHAPMVVGLDAVLGELDYIDAHALPGDDEEDQDSGEGDEDGHAVGVPTPDDLQEDPPRRRYRTRYGSVDEFYAQWLRRSYQRRIDGRRRKWSARWWENAEAVSRLDALWRAWECLRRDPETGLSVWWRDHADRQMAVLMDPDGPFSGVEDTEANTCGHGQDLPYEPPPPGLFPDERLHPN